MEIRGKTVLRRSLAGAVLVLCVAAPALAAAPRLGVHAKLVPAATVKRGAGTFTASGAAAKTVTVRWNLSVSNLSGPVKRATLKTGGNRKILFTLCQPCSAKSHGQLVLLGSVWNGIVASGGTVVVATRAHPAGELRGPLKRLQS